MDKVLTNLQMREADAYTMNDLGVTSAELMRRAGVAIADEAEKTAKLLKCDDILVVCGTGNNGGDGYVCAEELRKRGLNVAVYPLNGSLSADCNREKTAYKGRYLPHICGSIIIDCLFGTGLSRKIDGEIGQIINKINASGAYVISADIPSGLNGDNGLVAGVAVKANKTVAIAEYKSGFFLNDGLDVCGEIVKKDIGITCPPQNYINICNDEDVKKFFPARRRNSHKGTYGCANLVAGSEKYPGAAALSTSAALMSGCGFVKLTTCEKVKFSLVPKYPQTIFLDEVDLSSQSVAIGMGCGVTETVFKKISYILSEYQGSLLIDADGLNAISKFGKDILLNKKCKVILTPHLKEFSRLTGLSVEEISYNPVKHAQNFAKQYSVTLILKSASTVITDGARTVINVTGSTALSKGGSGDILSGYLCGSLARGLEPLNAAVCATYVLGKSAEFSSNEKTDYCATAKDIIKNLHFSVRNLTE